MACSQCYRLYTISCTCATAVSVSLLTLSGTYCCPPGPSWTFRASCGFAWRKTVEAKVLNDKTGCTAATADASQTLKQLPGMVTYLPTVNLKCWLSCHRGLQAPQPTSSPHDISTHMFPAVDLPCAQTLCSIRISLFNVVVICFLWTNDISWCSGVALHTNA